MDNPSTTLNSLPDELLLNIFSYLSVNDLFFRVQHVCTRWSQLCLYNVLWKNTSIFFRGINVPREFPLSVLEKLPRLQRLDVLTNHPRYLNKAAECCKNLRRLSIYSASDLEGCKEAFENIVSECKQLEELVIPYVFLGNPELAELIGKWNNLHTLSVIGCLDKRVTLEHIADGCPSLQRLHLMKVPWSYYDLKYFLEKKKDKITLLRTSPVSVEGESLLPLLKVCKDSLSTLKLDLRACNNPSEFATIKKLTNLKSVSLTPGLPENLMVSVFSNGGLSFLHEIKIKSCSVMNARIAQVICNNCPHLRKMVFTGAKKLNLDQGLQYIYKCPNLQYLNVSECSCDNGEIAMSNIVKCTKLKYLNVQFSGIESEYFGSLICLPDLEHVNISGCTFSSVPLDQFPLHLKKLERLLFSCVTDQDIKSFEKLHAKMPSLRPLGWLVEDTKTIQPEFVKGQLFFS